ncbi:MAG TPA: cation diffusion facilitator family transporter [Bacteroidales bacterium]|nr:cation diffusion facilitator family transporter [Bacteroidales bacterium]
MKNQNNTFESKTRWVVYITAVVMVVEIFFGLRTKSMALLADGIHMGSHVLAIGLSWMAYVIVRKVSAKGKYKGNTSKILSLAGYSSGLMLFIFAFVIMGEAIQRLYNPVAINFQEALLVATIGLFVNILSAFILRHDHHNSDHNIRAAYLHVLADALTSLTAIIGLSAALIWNIVWLDTLGAMLSSVVIIRWSVILLIDSGKGLLDL